GHEPSLLALVLPGLRVPGVPALAPPPAMAGAGALASRGHLPPGLGPAGPLGDAPGRGMRPAGHAGSQAAGRAALGPLAQTRDRSVVVDVSPAGQRVAGGGDLGPMARGRPLATRCPGADQSPDLVLPGRLERRTLVAGPRRAPARRSRTTATGPAGADPEL